MDVKIACVCPPKGEETRHPNGDTIVMRDRMDYIGAATIQQVLRTVAEEGLTWEQTAALLSMHYVLTSVESWTLTDAKGKAQPVTQQTIRAFLDEHVIEALDVGNVVNDPYTEQVVLPLVERAANSSQPTPTETATSPTSGTSTRKRSRRSSITSIPTAATGKTSSSPGGDGSTSTSSVSAA